MEEEEVVVGEGEGYEHHLSRLRRCLDPMDLLNNWLGYLQVECRG